MNYFKSLLFTACALVMLAACNNDDLQDDINNLKDRVESLEAQVGLLNDNMTAIKVLLEGGKTITDLKNVDGKYTLTLSNGDVITLTQGTKGEVKYPEISVNDKGEWVVNGSVLTQNGQPVLAVGTPGTNGTTPKFQVTTEGSYWQVSYDGGTTWTDVLDEAGHKVSATSGSDKFFDDVKVSEDGKFFLVKLKDATDYISIPIVKDVLCEIIAPVEGMNNGIWEIGYGKTVTTKVKVKGENIIATAPAGWTVTVGTPNVDTNEAVLTISAPKMTANASARATADNSLDVTIQANTGEFWAVDKIQVKAIEAIDSYYDYYMNGGTITVNGIEVNKEKFGEDAAVVKYIDTDQNITAAGVYFIKKGVTASYTGTGSAQDLVLIGNDPGTMSTVNVDAQIKLIQPSGEGHFLCKNIAITGTAKLANQLFTVNSDASFKYVAFDQCQIIPSTGKHLLFLSSNTRSIENFSMENSVFKSEAANQKYIISLSGSTSEGYKNITFKNNIFYCPDSKVNQFSLFNGTKAGITNFTLENNSFVNMETATTGMVYSNKLGTISVKKNLFWTNTSGLNTCIIFRPVTTSPTGTLCTDNIVYKTMTFDWQMFFGGKMPFEGAEELNMLTTDPFTGGTFDLANGTFIPNAEYASYGASIN